MAKKEEAEVKNPGKKQILKNPVLKKSVVIPKEPENIFNPKKFLIFIIVVVMIAILIAASTLLLNQRKCGDETIYGKCSSSKPYFCSNGKLIENASFCGCDVNMTRNGDYCISFYQEEPKNITLKYVLRGEEKEINFIVYKKLSDYLYSLPASIFYKKGEEPVNSRADFKLRNLNNKEQRDLLLPLVIKIQNEANDKLEQMRIAVSLVQGISYGSSDKKISFTGRNFNYSRYPYNVLYDSKGICGEKSELLEFILRELGFKTADLYYGFENHEAVGVKCPVRYSVGGTGYCFIETTGNSIITDSRIEYAGGLRLYSTPEVIALSDGASLMGNLYEYTDAQSLQELRKASEDNGGLNILQNYELEKLKKKYGLEKVYNVG